LATSVNTCYLKLIEYLEKKSSLQLESVFHQMKCTRLKRCFLGASVFLGASLVFLGASLVFLGASLVFLGASLVFLGASLAPLLGDKA
jgi:hypothetical protein